jgi:hypothetical protein
MLLARRPLWLPLRLTINVEKNLGQHSKKSTFFKNIALKNVGPTFTKNVEKC